MPIRPRSHCAVPGCPEFAVVRGRCRQHQTAEYRRIERTRGTAKARGYDADWRRVRDAVMAAEPLCRHCKAEGVVRVAVEVDHIVPLHKGGARLDRSNVQPLCRRHHQLKSAAEARERAS